MINNFKNMFDITCHFKTSVKDMPSANVKLDTPITIEVKSLNVTMLEIRETLNNIGSVAYVKTTSA